MVPSENSQLLVECLDDGENLFAPIRIAPVGKENDEESEGSEPLLVISAEEAGETGHCARAVAGVLPLLV